MARELYRYEFPTDVPLDTVEWLLVQAVLTIECLHGSAQTRLDAAHFLNADQRRCVIDADTAVGRDLNKVFVGFLNSQLGSDRYAVRRIATGPSCAGGHLN